MQSDSPTVNIASIRVVVQVFVIGIGIFIVIFVGVRFVVIR